MITDDDTLILSSEVGVLDIEPAKIVIKERLHPGKMLLVDMVQGRVIDDDELKETYASATLRRMAGYASCRIERAEDTEPARAGIYGRREKTDAESIRLYL